MLSANCSWSIGVKGGGERNILKKKKKSLEWILARHQFESMGVCLGTFPKQERRLYLPRHMHLEDFAQVCYIPPSPRISNSATAHINCTHFQIMWLPLALAAFYLFFISAVYTVWMLFREKGCLTTELGARFPWAWAPAIRLTHGQPVASSLPVDRAW